MIEPDIDFHLDILHIHDLIGGRKLNLFLSNFISHGDSIVTFWNLSRTDHLRNMKAELRMILASFQAVSKRKWELFMSVFQTLNLI